MAVSSTSSDVVDKSAATTTANSYTAGPTATTGGQTNILSNYRSFNYVFTFSALKSTTVNDPLKYRDSSLDLVIIRSGGKGTKGIVSPTNNELVNGFNKNSPGAFDMFIEDVEINSIMGFSENTSVSQPTTVSFDVIEPYSINGFIEALQVSAQAAGYPTYQNASFLLKIEFLGYSDASDFTAVEQVPMSTRYFPIKLTGVEVSVDQRGTRYKITAIPFNESGFGIPNKIKKSVKISGETVEDILNDLVKNINKQTETSDNDAKGSSTPDHDTYSVSFEGNASKLIGKAKVVELLSDNSTYSFPDAKTVNRPTAYHQDGQTTPSPQQNANDPGAYKPTYIKNSSAQFSEGKNITECMAAIIRDSKFGRDLMEKLVSNFKTVVDEYGMVDYFLIKIEVTNKTINNPDTKRPYQNFNFVIALHKIMYNRIPLFGNQHIDAKKLKKLALREYNYIYTGKNTEVLNFKLNFNTLYFEAIPAALGKNYGPPARDTAAYSNKLEAKLGADPGTLNGLPQAPRYVGSQLTAVDKDAGGSRQSDPYSSLAKGMHRAIVDSKASMLDGELEILGDPYFLVTGGIGNYNPKPSSLGPQMTEDGMAAHTYGEVLIIANFRNPIDIDNLEAGGRFRFDSELVPFSGVYRVNEVKSTFKDGLFKQSLKILRVPGQGDAVSTPATSQKKDPLDASTKDSSPATEIASSQGLSYGSSSAGYRPSELNLINQLGNGNPSPDVNFNGAEGGLGGAVIPGSSQVSGATDNLVGNTRLDYQPYGGVVPDFTQQTSQGIPLQPSGISALQEKILGPAALLSQLGNTLNTSFQINDPSTQLSSKIIDQSSSILNQVSVPGSGIGAGATVSYQPSTSVSSIIGSGKNVTAQDVRSQAATLPTNVNSANGAAAKIGIAALAAVAGMGGRSAGLVNGVSSAALSVTRGTPNDILAVGLQFGINANQLSGLSSILKTKMLDRLNSLAANIPANTNISTARAAGVNFNSLNKDGISKLPPTVPYSVAPQPRPDTAYINQLAASGGPSAVARSFGTNNITDVSQNQLPADAAQSAINSSPAQVYNPFGNTLQTNNITSAILGSKFLTANSQISGITGITGSVEGNLSKINDKFGPAPNTGGNLSTSVTSKFGSLTKTASPLDKIMLR